MEGWEHHHLREFTDWLTSWGASENTVHDRLAVIRAGLRVWQDPRDTTREQLEQWLGAPVYAAWTKVTYFSHLRSYFGWLAETGRIDGDPTVGMRRPTPPKGKPRPLSPEEEARVVGAASGDLRAWLLLGCYAGLRVHEVAKIRGEDISRRELYVVGKGGSVELLPTHPVVWELAQQYPRRGFWFPSPRAACGHRVSGGISTLVSRHFAALGIEGSFHRCRHSYGTNLLRGGANIRVVQTLMRHESLTSTQLYTAVDEDERTAAVRALLTPWEKAS